MMKKNILILSICFTVVVGISMWFLQSDENEMSNQQEIPRLEQFENVVSQQSYQNIPAKLYSENEFSEYQFSVVVETKISNQSIAIGEVEYRFNMALKPLESQKAQFFGQVYNIQWPSQYQGEDRPKKLTFTTQMVEGAFVNTNLLGLSASHPLTLIETALTQFSYYLGNKTLMLADGKHQFIYSRESAERIEREWLGSVSTADTYDVVDQNDQWQLTHDQNGVPQSLVHTHSKTVNYETQILTIVQHIEVKPVSRKSHLDWNIQQYAIDVNRHWQGIGSEIAGHLDNVDEENFKSRFGTFAQSPDLDNAFAIGGYLAKQGFNNVKDLLTNQNLTNDQQSLLIFCLERSQSPEGEYILSQLIEDHTLDEQNRLRAIMSIAKMGEVSSIQALHTLETVAQSTNSMIAQTALLNIGILGNNSEVLRSYVTDYLSNNLKSGNSVYDTLVSIGNLNSSGLDDEVVAYTQSEHFDERMAAVKVLAKNPRMESHLKSLILKDSNPNVLKEIVDAHLAKEEVKPFESGYQRQLRERITERNLPTPAKEMLFEYLLSGSENHLENNQVAEQLLNDPDLSDSLRETLEKMLDN